MESTKASSRVSSPACAECASSVNAMYGMPAAFSVSRAMANLKRDGYIDMAPGGELTLTASGLSTARNVYERHTTLSSFLAALGVSDKTAADDACLVEHVISDESFARIKSFVENGCEVTAPSADDSERTSKDDKKKKKKKKKS